MADDIYRIYILYRNRSKNKKQIINYKFIVSALSFYIQLKFYVEKQYFNKTVKRIEIFNGKFFDFFFLFLSLFYTTEKYTNKSN